MRSNRIFHFGLILVMTSVLLLSIGSLICLAELPAGPFFSYTLGLKNQQVPSPVPFEVDRIIYGEILGVGSFAEPEDLFMDHERNVFIVDKGNSRVIKMTQDGEVLMVIEEDLDLPSGVFVTKEGDIFVADTENERIAVFNSEGLFLKEITAPESVLLGEDFMFRPTKLVVETSGIMYVISSGEYRGIMQMTIDGRFLGWYAPNRVPFDPLRNFIKAIASPDQIAQTAKAIPNPTSNLYMDKKGFLWTACEFEKSSQLKHIVVGGLNVFPEQVYGQIFWPAWWWQRTPKFYDIAYDEARGIITAIDQEMGYIYQYNRDGEALLVYGGKANQEGTFGHPTSLLVDERGYIWVLDGGRGNLQIFKPTEWASIIYEANHLYVNAKYTDAEDTWKNVLQRNTNYRLARNGLGKAYFKQHRWKDAMEQYYLGRYRDGYSEAFAKYRKEFAREHFEYFFFGIIGCVILLVVIFRFARSVVRRSKKGNYETKEISPRLRSLAQVIRVITEPKEVFWEVKQKPPVVTAFVLLGLLLIVRVLGIYGTSFHFSALDPEDTNFLSEISKVLLPFISWIIGVYGISMIVEGEGTFKQLFCACSLSLLPYIILSPLQTLLTHIFALTEATWLYYIETATTVWMVYLFYTTVRVINNYEIPKTISVMAFGTFLMLIGWGVIFVLYSYSTQVLEFVRAIIIETAMR